MNNQTPPPPPPIRPRQTKTKAQVVPRPVKKTEHKKRSPRTHIKRRRHQPVRRELSAGGVAARQERGQWLVALLKTEHKKGPVWILPKGHVEPETGETIAEAGKREVSEEAGITDLSIKDQLGTTRFAFQAETALVRKTVHYFLMTTNQVKLHPQAEEGMIDAAWFPIDIAIKTLEYDTDQDIVIKAKEKLMGIKAAEQVRQQYGTYAKNARRIKLHT